MDLYDLNRSVAPFVGFIDLLTNWYIRRSRRRFWKAGQGSDKLEAYATLFQVLRNLSRVIAPFVPFIADGIHRALKQPGDPESVHLCLFPEKEAQMNRDSDLEQRMELVLSAVTMAVLCGPSISSRSASRFGKSPSSLPLPKPSGFWKILGN